MGSVVRRKTHTRSFSTIFVATCIAVLALTAMSIADVPPGVNTGGGQNNHNDGPITPPNYVEGQVVVKPISDTVSMEAMALGFDATVQKQMVGFGAYLLEVDPGDDPFAVAAALEGEPGVEYAHPNYLINPLHPVQGSYPFSDEQATGDFRGQLPVSTLQLADAHSTTTGAGVKVGVIDGGVDYNHSELASHVTLGYDVVDSDNDPMDEPGGPTSGHGTFVAGIVNLVAPDAEIRAYRVTNALGYGDGYGLAEAIQRAVLDGCDVINISVVMMAEHPLVSDVIAFARSQGVVVVVAAGNEGEETVAFPATDPNTIAVAAIDSLNQVADFSSYGSSVDVCAPGTWIYSTYQNDGFAWWSGTSFAAPFVAGQAALLKSLYPTATPEQVASVISGSATDLSTINPEYPGMIGTGLVDPPQAFSLYASLDFASVSPDTLQFTGFQNDEVLRFAGAYLYSGTGPTPYTAEVLQTADLFASLTGSRSGVTNDTVTIQAEVADLAPGTYYNTIRFTVAGVTQPVDLVVSMTVQQQEFASITPDTVWITAPVGAVFIQPEIRTAFLTSTNAPAAYTAEILPDSLPLPPLFSLGDSAGFTNDTVSVYISTGPALEGIYYTTVNYNVEGVADPAQLVVVVEGTSSGSGSDSVWVQPDEITFIVDENELAMGPVYTDVQTVMIHSTNEPAAYIATTLDTIDVFAMIDDTAGVTGDSALVMIAAGSAFTEGTYYNTIRIDVPGVGQSGYLTVQMIVTGDTVGTGLSSVTVSPYSQFFRAPIDSPYVETGSVYLSTTLGASDYTAEVLGINDFIVLNDTIGITEDSFYFDISTGAGLAEGLYTDTIAFWVNGAASNPQIAIVYLITGDSIGTGLSTVSITPRFQAFNAPIDSPYVEPGSVYISTTKGASDYTVQVLGVNDFIVLNDTVGVTEDSFYFEINTGAGLAEGWYTDTLAFWVNGAAYNPQLAVVYLTTGDSVGTGLGNVTLTPTWLGWTVMENQPFSIDTSLFIHNTKGQYEYWASVVSPNDFTVLHDTAGMTETYVNFTVESTTGLAPGLYIDSIAFLVNNSIYATNPKHAVLLLQVIADTSGTGGGGETDSVWVLPADTVVVNYEYGSLALLGPVEAIVRSTNEPATFAAWVDGSPTFATLWDSLGVTGDSVYVNTDPTGLAPGTYFNTVYFGVTGITQPGELTIQFNITDTSGTGGGGGTDSVWTSWDTVIVNYAYGSFELLGPISTFVYSTNQPAAFSAWVTSGGPIFASLVDSLGTTGDSVQINTDPTGLTPGTYYNDVHFGVSGITEPGLMVVQFNITDSSGGVSGGPDDVSEVSLGNYPNPFNPETNISFSIPHATQVTLSIYNVLGQKVRTLVDREFAAGEHTVVWDGSADHGGKVASGIYFYRIQAGDISVTRKMMMLK